MRICTSISLSAVLAMCLISNTGCELVSTDQDTIELELFNDASDPIHILLENEARAPSNQIQPGAARIVTARFMQNGSLFVAAQNNLGVDVFGGCPFVDEEFDSENPFTGQIIYTGEGNFFTCTGSAFK
ncbi:MAG TPA: hypothetical protein PKN33_14995 [Phycisphaerae bacterium]|nr:hypothetical protein [Phycisphaerae bacterium]